MYILVGLNFRLVPATMIYSGMIADLFLFQVNGGRDSRPIGAYELAKAVEELGAGEILLNCIDCDGIFTVAE